MRKNNDLDWELICFYLNISYNDYI
jgi:hypothetical protein